jgi:integrase
VLAPFLAHKSKRNRRLQDGEEQRLLTHADEYIRDMMYGILDTGLRGGSLRSLTWADVQATHLVVPTTKQKRGKDTLRIRISPRLGKVLNRRRNGPDGHGLPDDALIFGGPIGERLGRERFGELWRATCLAAGIKDLHFHDLRGEAGSRLLEAGVPLNDVRDALGHASVTMTDTYLRARTSALDEAYQRLHEGNVLPFRGFSQAFSQGKGRSSRKAQKLA